MSSTVNETISLNKFISDTGYCSRREADDLITSGRVLLNGRVAALGNRYKPGDEVEVDGSLMTAAKKEKRIYIALNKPVGITTTTESHIKDNIISFVDHPKRIFPIGRLDKDSEGLIFLTNDGDIINKILRADNKHEKEYVVRVNKPIDHAFVQQMSQGVPILDTRTLPCKVQMIGRQTFKITLTQGLNRQIRRMCEHLGYIVMGLQRTRIMNIKLDKLAVGKWRYLSEPEMAILMEAVADSATTDTTGKPAKKKKRFIHSPGATETTAPKEKFAHTREKAPYAKDKPTSRSAKPAYDKEKPAYSKDKKATYGKDKPAHVKEKPAYKKEKNTRGKDRPAHAAKAGKPKFGTASAKTHKPHKEEGVRKRPEKDAAKTSGPPKKGSFKDFRRKGRG
jgi:23S rRNA pseudouridine2604 synthase